MPARPFRATVYLPGHDESGRSPVVRKVSASTEAGLTHAIDRYVREGYRVRAYETLTLDLGEEPTP